MQFLLCKTPLLILLPLVRGAKIFSVELHISHPKFVRGFQYSLYRVQFRAIVESLKVGLFCARQISASVNLSVGCRVWVRAVWLFSFEIHVGRVIREDSFNGVGV